MLKYKLIVVVIAFSVFGCVGSSVNNFLPQTQEKDVNIQFPKVIASDLDGIDTMAIVLVKQDGTALWRSSGAYNEDKLQEIRNYIF